MNQKTMPADFNTHHSRLRITIPREPELETAQRAERQRAQRLRLAFSRVQVKPSIDMDNI